MAILTFSSEEQLNEPSLLPSRARRSTDSARDKSVAFGRNPNHPWNHPWKVHSVEQFDKIDVG